MLPWVGSRCDGMIYVTAQGQKWQAREKLMDRMGADPLYLSEPREVVATYVCSSLDDPNSGVYAVAKVRMQ